MNTKKPNTKLLDLNPQQMKAANWDKGPVLIIAGAGTGKTRVLVNRVAKLVEKGVEPQKVLLLTFTRRAASEMLDKASIILGGDKNRIKKVSGGTFHSFANKILRKNAQKINISNDYTILDRIDSADVIDLVREKLKISKKDKRFPFKKTLEKIINISMNKKISYGQLIEEDYPHFIAQIDDINKIAEKYQSYKLNNNLIDYNDLLIYLKKILKQYPQIADYYSYIMVDEYQDTNKIQGEITYLLAKKHRNVMVVGDDTQSIYSFRGANFKNMFDFKEKFFPDVKIIKLEENYRSTQPILDMANGIIDNAIEKYTKVLFTKNKRGDIPELIYANDEENQAEKILEKILDLHKRGVNLNDISVLFRASYQAIPLEIQLKKNGINYVKHGGFKFFETSHIKDIMAYFKVIQNPKDEVSWYRILLLLRGIGEVTCKKILKNILKYPNPFAKIKTFMPKNKKIRNLSNTLSLMASKKTTPKEKMHNLLTYYNPILIDKFDDFPKRKEDLLQLESIIEQYSNLNDFLTDMLLEPPSNSNSNGLYVNENYSKKNTLCLSTIHSAKGLEWHTVFVIDMAEGRFPISYYLNSIESEEEERRLFYVACTRAKEKLYITYPATIRGTLSNKSTFLKEIQHLLKSDTSDTPMYLEI